METSPLPVKGCKIPSYARRSGPLSREGSLTCHTCCATGPRFFGLIQRTVPFSSLLRHTRGCGGSILNPDPHRDLEKKISACEIVGDSAKTDGMFCLCRGPDNGEFMIQCNVCKEWYHCLCVSVTREPLSRSFVYSCTSNFSAIWRLSPLPVTGLCSAPLRREGSLSCHTYCDTGPRFIRSHPKDRYLHPTVGFETPDARIIRSLRPMH
jgi:hypothetical protein